MHQTTQTTVMPNQLLIPSFFMSFQSMGCVLSIPAPVNNSQWPPSLASAPVCLPTSRPAPHANPVSSVPPAACPAPPSDHRSGHDTRPVSLPKSGPLPAKSSPPSALPTPGADPATLKTQSHALVHACVLAPHPNRFPHKPDSSAPLWRHTSPRFDSFPAHKHWQP